MLKFDKTHKGDPGQLLVTVIQRPAREFAGVAGRIFGIDVARNDDGSLIVA
jgi:hypothetical protein